MNPSEPRFFDTPAFRPMKVLVADDMAGSRMALAQAVQALGHQAICCDGGIATLAAVQADLPDLVFLDLLMPDLDGYEVTRRLRQQVAGTWLPVIVTSALEGDQHFVAALTRGADDYLPRPVNPELLKARLLHYQRVLALRTRLTLVTARERLIHEHIPDCVFTFNPQQQLCDTNKAARQLLADCGHHEKLGLPVAQLLGIDLHRPVQAPQTTVHLQNGSERTYAISHSRWQQDTTAYTTLVLRDRSEHLHMERMKDEFLATVSHELRTPLTSIIGAIGILNAGAAGAMPEKATPLLQMAQRNGERLSRLIDDVMDLTKLEGERITLKLAPVKLAALLQDAVRGMAGYALKHRVQVTLQAPAPEAVALADSERLAQIMANLLSNAIKHSPPEGQVQVALRGHRSGWCIEVRDQGPGIASHFQARLFEKFAQEDGADNRNTQGTGLGLYISRMLARRMGGDVVLAPQHAAGGATFAVLLRVAAAAHLPTLVISRDVTQRERFREWISPCGPVVTAPDLKSAQDWIDHHGPVLALVADLAAQGGADTFFSALARLCPPDCIVLAGDAADHAFAKARHAVWVSPGPAARLALVSAVDKARQHGRSTAEEKKTHA